MNTWSERESGRAVVMAFLLLVPQPIYYIDGRKQPGMGVRKNGDRILRSSQERVFCKRSRMTRCVALRQPHVESCASSRCG